MTQVSQPLKSTLTAGLTVHRRQEGRRRRRGGGRVGAEPGVLDSRQEGAGNGHRDAREICGRTECLRRQRLCPLQRIQVTVRPRPLLSGC